MPLSHRNLRYSLANMTCAIIIGKVNREVIRKSRRARLEVKSRVVKRNRNRRSDKGVIKKRERKKKRSSLEVQEKEEKGSSVI